MDGYGLGGGRVEIFHDGSWGTVCDDDFNDRAAAVVCKQMGFTGGEALLDQQYGPGDDPIWLDDVRCRGDEKDLDSCVHLRWSLHDCGHNEDVGVVCDF